LSIWALSDPHLSFGVPDKSMSVFGPAWEDYTDKIAENWKKLIAKEDLVLIPGDISWAMRLEEAFADLNWIDALPGTKVILRGNHDYWWTSSAKMKKAMPASIHFIHNSAFTWEDVTIGGSRLWDSSEYRFNSFVEYKENPKAKMAHTPPDVEEDERIFLRELERLRLSLSQLDPNASLRIALTHYPPIGADLKPSRVSAILEEYKIDICVFGHLHNLKKDCLPLFGTARGIRYVLSSCDVLDFVPLKIR